MNINSLRLIENIIIAKELKKELPLARFDINQNDICLVFIIFKKKDLVGVEVKWTKNDEEHSDRRTFGQVKKIEIKQQILNWIQDVMNQVGVSGNIVWKNGNDIIELDSLLEMMR